jgi:hypothetical protein
MDALIKEFRLQLSCKETPSTVIVINQQRKERNSGTSLNLMSVVMVMEGRSA